MNAIEKLLAKKTASDIARMNELEKAIASEEGAIKADASSPVKAWPRIEKIPSGYEIPLTLKSIAAIGRLQLSATASSMKSLQPYRPKPSRDSLAAGELSELRMFCAQKGVGIIGFTDMPANLIFRDRAILFDKAIVLLYEMDEEAVNAAPGVKTFKMSFETYDRLGAITNELTEKIRQMGFAAHASHPMGGLALYPPLASRAGLGSLGKHGMLITPELGPRQRISAVLTNISNLPVANNEAVMSDKCASCNACASLCPAGAFYEEPIKRDYGYTTVDIDKCVREFSANNACSVCLKACSKANAGSGL
ncbi:MAG: hypothetical protein FWG30_07305 [Eubacteriaceae bacterium]|nr:hypothetical protein [Eubacteriaceae bacterium]